MTGNVLAKKIFINNESECSRIIASFDWRRHPLGNPENWPQSLITTLGILLHSKFPMFLFWGREHYCFYNDAYRPSLGIAGKHPDAIGKTGKEVWPEIWDVIYPQIAQVMGGGEATWHEDVLLPIFRNNKLEDVYWTYSYSTVFDETAKVAGVFVTCSETTAKVISEKKLIDLSRALRSRANAVARSNDQLTKNIERLNKAEKMAHFGSFEWNIKSGKITWSDELYRIFGTEPGLIEPDVNFALEHNDNPVEKERILKKLDYCIANNMPFTEIFEFTRNDGSQRMIKIDALLVEEQQSIETTMSGVIIDITEKERLEKERLELAAIIENSLNEIYIFDASSLKFMYINEGALLNIGYTFDELIELTPVDITPEFSTESFRNMMNPLIKHDRRIVVFNTVHLRKNGSTYPVEVHLQKMTYLGKPVLVAIIIDTTVQQDALRQREQERLENEALINNTSDSLWSVDREQKLITANQSFIKKMQAASGKIVNRGDDLLLNDLFSDTVLDDYQTAYKKALMGQKIVMEIRNQNAAGLVNEWTELSLNPIIDDDAIIGVACYAKDITESKNVTLRLQESENKYKLLFESSPLPKLVYDLGTLHILDVNEASLEKYGYTKSQMLELDMNDLRPASEKKDFLSLIKQLKDGHHLLSYGPMVYKKKDGTTFTADVNLHKINYNGKEAVIAIISDISEKQAYENKLKQLNKSLLESNRELQQFASRTAHDLQEPLRMISNFTGLLEKNYGDIPDEKALQYIYFAKDGANRMQHLIADILEYARVDGKSAGFEPVNIDEIIKQVLKDMKHRIEKTKAVINYTGDNVNIMGNANLLYRLILNLISNALKFVSKDTNPVVSISVKDKGRIWEFAITDNGIGIAAEDQAQLFTAFNRLHSRQSYEGSGLGLATCKKIVEQHHGKIWLHSEEGKGTTFYFTFKKIIE